MKTERVKVPIPEKWGIICEKCETSIARFEVEEADGTVWFYCGACEVD